ncbi:MAG: imidazolonepropionase-like domain-containing protein [Haloferula sp.]
MNLTSCLIAVTLAGSLAAQTSSLQDLSKATEQLPKAVIYTAKEVVTLDPDKPEAEAVAVVGDRILAVGSLDELKQAAGDQPLRVDDTFKDHVHLNDLNARDQAPWKVWRKG